VSTHHLSKIDTWMGVPDKITRRFTSRELRAWNVSDSGYVKALNEQGRGKGYKSIYQSSSSDVPRRKAEDQSCNWLNALSEFSMSRTKQSSLRIGSQPMTLDDAQHSQLAWLCDVSPTGRDPACHLLEQLGLPTFSIHSQRCYSIFTEPLC
jgi:hypothetical protein